ncbi:heme-binding domain-containing protein [Mucilaginibacter sp. UYCu711]|uniref:heme-binding domain-containing protein n=1 Tax=Mucilaginibacter sp. UYCu711 TaxID=3156339 RepID=UPI003D1DC053
MKRVIKISLIVIVALFIIIQFIPRDHNESEAMAANDISKVYAVPVNVGAILKRSCYDCHSNHTEYPLYSWLQPIRLMMDRHVSKGKEELNFNAFGTYSSRKKSSKLRAIGESLEEGSMPLSSYTLIHRNAILSTKDKATLMNWVKQNSDSPILKN